VGVYWSPWSAMKAMPLVTTAVPIDPRKTMRRTSFSGAGLEGGFAIGDEGRRHGTHMDF